MQHVFSDDVMSNSEEDSYSMIFASLKHPIRRRILRILSEGAESFSDLQKQFKIESSHLTYHIEGLGSLLYKTEDGKYALSSVGEAAVSTMKHVEEPTRTALHLSSTSHRMQILRLLTFILICGLIASLVFNGVLLFRYNELGKAYSELNARGRFGIYLSETNKLAISDQDIVWYNKTSYDIKLTLEGVEKIKALPVSVFGAPFVVRIDGIEVCNGSFVTPISSIPAPPSEIIIETLVQNDTIHIQMGYPPSQFGGQDLRDNPKIFDYFQAIGKLVV